MEMRRGVRLEVGEIREVRREIRGLTISRARSRISSPRCTPRRSTRWACATGIPVAVLASPRGVDSPESYPYPTRTLSRLRASLHNECRLTLSGIPSTCVATCQRARASPLHAAAAAAAAAAAVAAVAVVSRAVVRARASA